MKNLLKKFAVITASLMLAVTTFAMPSFAADSTTLTVGGVEAGATVNGYKVVEADTNNNWKMVDAYGTYNETEKKWYVKGTQVEYNFLSPSKEALAELAKIASGKTADLTNWTYSTTDKKYSKACSTVGSYLILAEPAAVGTIYNPMLVSVNPEGSGVASPDKNNNVVANTTDAYAKKSDIPFEKVVERKSGVATGTNLDNNSVTGDALDNDPQGDNASAVAGYDGNRGDTAGSTGGSVTLDKDGNATFSAEGATFDNVQFRINTTIPKYADNYFKADSEGKYPAQVGDFYNPTFKVDDELSAGLTLNDDIVVKVGTATATKGTDYKVTSSDTKDFIITFEPAFIKANGGQAVEITYTAKLNKDHGVNFDEETNTAKLYYSNKPGKNTTVDEERETYHYTFTINGMLEGNENDENREVIKVGIDGEGNRIMQETVCVTEKKDSWKPLQGVTFKLYKANQAGNGPDKSVTVKDVITDKDGILRGMDQIDAGVYYLVEESVGPNTEYAKDTTPIRIEITPTLDNKGRMTAYQVKVGKDAENMITVGDYVKDWTVTNPQATTVLNGKKVNTSANYGLTTHTYIDNDAEAADIVNTKVGTLPSTGGMGTILFTIGGIILIGLAFLLLFGGRRKQHQK